MCDFGTGLRCSQSATARGWKPKTSDSTRLPSASQAGMSTHTTPPSWLSRLFRSPICRRSTPEGDTSRMSTSLTTLKQPLDHHTGPRILARPDGDTPAGVGRYQPYLSAGQHRVASHAMIMAITTVLPVPVAILSATL